MQKIKAAEMSTNPSPVPGGASFRSGTAYPGDPGDFGVVAKGRRPGNYAPVILEGEAADAVFHILDKADGIINSIKKTRLTVQELKSLIQGTATPDAKDH